MNIDKDLIKFCKDNYFQIDEMTDEDFKAVENTLVFKRYKLGLEFKKIGKEALNALKQIEHRKKSCKNFKCK